MSGILVYALHHEGDYYFGSFNSSPRIERLEASGDMLNLVIRGRKGLRLTVYAKMGRAGELKAPQMGTMDRIIRESLDARISVKAEAKSGRTIYTGTGHPAGLEIMGEVCGLKK